MDSLYREREPASFHEREGIFPKGEGTQIKGKEGLVEMLNKGSGCEPGFRTLQGTLGARSSPWPGRDTLRTQTQLYMR